MPTPNIDGRPGVKVPPSLSEDSLGGVAGTEEDLALGGEKSCAFSTVGGVVALRAFLRGGRFSFTRSLGSVNSVSDSSSTLLSNAAKTEIGVDVGTGEVSRRVGMRRYGS